MPQHHQQPEQLSLPVSDRRDHIRNPSGAVTLVEYGDFQCPHCGRAHPILNELMERMGDDIRFVFRHFTLSQIHPDAQSAAEAAEAAAAQGKFWEMHDSIFHHQHALEDANLAEFAKAVGLDLQQYTRDMAERRALARIEEDVEGGERSGVQGTPTFFINGVLYSGSWEQDALLPALQAASRTA